jgi:phage terminase small subunit
MGLNVMTPKQQRFVEEYLIDLNATAAYRRAGYTATGNAAEVNAARLLRNAKVAEAITAAQDSRSERTEITQDMVLRELAKIGFSDMRKLLKWGGTIDGFDETAAEENGEVRLSVANLVQLFDSDELDDDTAACVSEISQTKDGALKVKLHDKQAALVNIGRHLGMFKDRVEHTGKDGGPIEMEQVVADADAFTRTIASLAARGRAGAGDSETQH